MSCQEAVLVTAYQRNELLHCCLKRIFDIDPFTPVFVFPDRGTFFDAEFMEVMRHFPIAQPHLIGKHNWNGNTANTMEAFRWAFNEGYDRVFYIEEDVMVHPDFFDWHRQQHEWFPDIFASMGWVFNHHAPITDDIMFQPWYYSIGTCFSRAKLGLIAAHASPIYYENMPSYIAQNFANSKLNSALAVAHFEQDGLIQRVMERDKSQTVCAGIAKCSHVGSHGYNKKNGLRFSGTLEQRIQQTEEFISDPYWRADVFGRPIVEREIGYKLAKREFQYLVRLPGGWESTFTTEVDSKHLPPRINSAPLPPNTEISVVRMQS